MSTFVKAVMGLAATILGIVAAYPFLPGIYFEFEKAHNLLFDSNHSNNEFFSSYETVRPSGENWLIIPAIGVNSVIIEGENNEALKKGVWHRPGTGIPGTKTNTVLTGHRFLYTGFSSNTFYNLDKVEKGDEVIVFWGGKRFMYKVTERKIVNPQQTEIEGDFEDERVTIYTCHPLWTADKRLVLVAKPM